MVKIKRKMPKEQLSIFCRRREYFPVEIGKGIKWIYAGNNVEAEKDEKRDRY